jgi:hypothetical protein
MEQKIEQARAKILNITRTLNNSIGYDEAAYALVLGLIAKENVMLVGPRGAAFELLVNTLSKLVQAQPTAGDGSSPLRRLAFIKNPPNQPLEDRDAWILIVAADEEKSEEVQGRFIKAFVKHLNDYDLLLAVKTRWLYNYAPIATMDDVKALHEYAISLLGKEDVIKAYYENVISLVEELRKKGITISDEYVIEVLPKLYAAYLAVHGVTPENMVGAAFDIILYVAQSPEELYDIKKAIDENEVAKLFHILSEGKQLLQMMDYKGALEVFREVMSYDATHLPPEQRQKAEVLIRAASEYAVNAQEVIRVLKEGAQ